MKWFVIWKPNDNTARTSNYTWGEVLRKNFNRLYSLCSSGKLIKSEIHALWTRPKFCVIFHTKWFFTLLCSKFCVWVNTFDWVWKCFCEIAYAGTLSTPLPSACGLSSNLGNNYLPFSFIDFYWLNDITTRALSRATTKRYYLHPVCILSWYIHPLAQQSVLYVIQKSLY